MKTREEILDSKFKERGIRKGWIDESRQAVLDAMEEYADEKLRLYHVRLPLSEYVERKQQEAWDKMGDTGNYDYSTEKMNWNEENFWFGYFRALEDLEGRFLEDNEA